MMRPKSSTRDVIVVPQTLNAASARMPWQTADDLSTPPRRPPDSTLTVISVSAPTEMDWYQL